MEQVSVTKASTIKLGIDVYLRQYMVVRQVDHAAPQPAQRFTPEEFLRWVVKPAGVCPHTNLASSSIQQCFNPRPVVSHGATYRTMDDRPQCLCFNPRPVVSHGATQPLHRESYPAERFNPRPVVSHGATIHLMDGARLAWFQSAPRGFPRGDSVGCQSD